MERFVHDVVICDDVGVIERRNGNAEMFVIITSRVFFWVPVKSRSGGDTVK